MDWSRLLTDLPQTPKVSENSGTVAGDRITPFYDPMIMKVIAHGKDRAQAVARLDVVVDLAQCLLVLASADIRLHWLLERERPMTLRCEPRGRWISRWSAST